MGEGLPPTCPSPAPGCGLPRGELPVEQAGLLPEHHHHIAARIQVGARDGHLGASGHGSPAGLQVRESQRLCRKGSVLTQPGQAEGASGQA